MSAASNAATGVAANGAANSAANGASAAAKRQIFLDTETTGLAAEGGDRIVEIGCIEMVERRLTGRTLHLYLNPERASHPDALKVHGLTEEFLADKPKYAQVAEQIEAFVAGAELIIHNADFDMGFLKAEAKRAGRPDFSCVPAKVSDSLLLAREIYPGKGNSLDALCKRLEVDNSHRDFHGALLDAGLLAEVYLRMTRGQKALAMDAGEQAAGANADGPQVDLRSFELPVLAANDEELAAHAKVLEQIDKASGARTVWRKIQAPVSSPSQGAAAAAA